MPENRDPRDGQDGGEAGNTNSMPLSAFMPINAQRAMNRAMNPPQLERTQTMLPRQQSCRVHHFFTWNNPPDDYEDVLDACLREHCYQYAYQLERADSGTLHLQGVISCKRQRRWTSFALPDGIHWEKVSNLVAAYKYCTKEETRVKGPYTFNYHVPIPIKFITPDRQYQTFILDIIADPPNCRDIHWFFDRIGNVGKSCFCKYLVGKHDALFIDEGTKANIVNMVYNWKLEIKLIVVDVPRANKNKVSYKSLEAIKNGMIMNSKYETGQKMFNSPHVIIFANFPPDVNNETISVDRMNVFEITQVYFEAVQRQQHEYEETIDNTYQGFFPR